MLSVKINCVLPFKLLQKSQPLLSPKDNNAFPHVIKLSNDSLFLAHVFPLELYFKTTKITQCSYTFYTLMKT